jgi:hypothetical protein
MRLRYVPATLAVTLAVSGVAGVSSASAGDVWVTPVAGTDYALFGYTDGSARNDIAVRASGGVPGKPKTIVLQDHGSLINPVSAIQAGCEMQSLHQVTCTTTSDHFGFGYVDPLEGDDRIAVAQDSQLIYAGTGPGGGWGFTCGDGEDHVLADPSQYSRASECETVEGY